MIRIEHLHEYDSSKKTFCPICESSSYYLLLHGVDDIVKYECDSCKDIHLKEYRLSLTEIREMRINKLTDK